MHYEKFRHVSLAEAQRHLKQQKDCSGENRKVLNRLGVYFCVRCGAFHIGHNKLKGKQYAKSGPKMRSAHRVDPQQNAGKC